MCAHDVFMTCLWLPVASPRIRVLLLDPACRLLRGTASFTWPVRAGRWGLGGAADGNNREAVTARPLGNRKLKSGRLISQPPSKMLSSILGKSNLQFAGMNISLTVSTASLNLRTPDSKQVCRRPGPLGVLQGCRLCWVWQRTFV